MECQHGQKHDIERFEGSVNELRIFLLKQKYTESLRAKLIVIIYRYLSLIASKNLNSLQSRNRLISAMQLARYVSEIL